MDEPKMPRISIVTPSFNQASYVVATVRSVLLQRYPRLEYIFMDGGSTDGTVERLAPYRDRFAHFQSAKDDGQSAAIAAGFLRSSGDIMGYLNSDDVLLPGTLAFVAEYFRRHPDVDFIYGNRAIIDAANRVTGHWILPRHSNFLMRHYALMPQESCFWRSSLWHRAGNIDTSFQFAMDFELFVRMMRHGRFRHVRRFLAAFRTHPEAKTSREMMTTGVSEVSRVYSKHRLLPIPGLGEAFSLAVQLRSAFYMRGRERFAGLSPGVGVDLDDFWGGQLVE